MIRQNCSLLGELSGPVINGQIDRQAGPEAWLTVNSDSPSKEFGEFLHNWHPDAPSIFTATDTKRKRVFVPLQRIHLSGGHASPGVSHRNRNSFVSERHRYFHEAIGRMFKRVFDRVSNHHFD